MNIIFFIVIAGFLVAPVYGRRIGSYRQNIVSTVPESTTSSATFPLTSVKILKEDIVQKLDNLLAHESVDESWYEKVNDLVAELATIDKNVSTLYLKKIIAKTSVSSEKPIPKLSSSEEQRATTTTSETIAKDVLIKKLDDLLYKEVIDEGHYDLANDLVMELASIDRGLSHAYFKKILDKIAQEKVKKAANLPIPLPERSKDTEKKVDKGGVIDTPMAEQKTEQTIQPPIQTVHKPSIPTPLADNNEKKEIVKKLDNLLQKKTINESWYTAVDNLVFDLAFIDRNLSNEYLKKVREKTVAVDVAPVGMVLPVKDGSMQKDIQPAALTKGTPPPPPAMKKGSPPPPPPSGGMKKGSPPPPPSPGVKKGTPPPPPGPMSKGNKPISVSKGKLLPASSPKGPDPLTIRESYGARQLEKRTNEEVMELFNKLLEALGTYPDFWDVVQKKPKLDWENKINTVKKSLLDPKRNIHLDIVKVIADRIVQVRAEKAKEGLAKQAASEKKEEEKPQEEFSETELIAKIEALKKREKVNDMLWLIEFQGNVKKLDKVNHEKAVVYESEFIKKFAGQKPFLPRKKPIEVK